MKAKPKSGIIPPVVAVAINLENVVEWDGGVSMLLT